MTLPAKQRAFSDINMTGSALGMKCIGQGHGILRSGGEPVAFGTRAVFTGFIFNNLAVEIDGIDWDDWLESIGMTFESWIKIEGIDWDDWLESIKIGDTEKV